jgi:hypothetical protein
MQLLTRFLVGYIIGLAGFVTFCISIFVGSLAQSRCELVGGILMIIGALFHRRIHLMSILAACIGLVGLSVYVMRERYVPLLPFALLCLAVCMFMMSKYRL